MEKEGYLLREQFIVDILKYCNGENDIRKISKLSHVSYKTCFFKLKDLENAGIIEFDKKTKGSKPFVTKKWEVPVGTEILIYDKAKDDLQLLFQNKKYMEIAKMILEEAYKNRLIDRGQIMAMIFDKYGISFKDEKEALNVGLIAIYLQQAQLIKERVDITKSGLRFLKSLKGEKVSKK